MILILSQASHESTTEAVMDWLEALGEPFFRLNGEDIDGVTALDLELGGGPAGGVDFAFADERFDFPFRAVTAVWYRRWQHHQRFVAVPLLPADVPDSGGVGLRVVKHLSFELWKVSDFLFSRLGALPWLSDPRRDSPNKLEILERAARHGLDTPATLVTTRRQSVERFAERHGGIITKCIGEPDMFFFGDRFFMLYTAELGPSEIAGLPDRFFPSLFQERLEKRYELRVFYLDGQCHAMAIFSQLDARTQVDFRRYNNEKPNRTVPFSLPGDVEAKLIALMKSLELETGSIDLVRTVDGRYVFLEVNPIGQFGMVSRPCNFFLERKVAELLVRKASHAKT